MRASLRHVDPRRPPGAFRRRFSALAATKAALFLSRHVSWRLDPVLLKVTRGRVSSALMLPTAVLETRGARTGAVRRNAVIYFHDASGPAERVIIAASNGGSPRHPSWYHNLLAHPEVIFGGIAMRAAPITGGERDRLWSLADRLFPAYAVYRERAAAAGREIPLVGLVPRADGSPMPERS